MTCINNYRQLMGKIGDLAGLPVVSRALNEIAQIASEFGLACKPCGAGGGDLAMLAGTDGRALELACDSLAARGWSRLRLETAQQGLQVDYSRS
jgi:mevalonate kinase